MIKLVFLIVVFCIVSGFVKSEEKHDTNNQNLYQHIKTEIIDLPDGTGTDSGNIDPYMFQNRDVVLTWPYNNNAPGTGQSQNYPSVYPDSSYYSNSYPSYQQPYYQNYPYVYRPFYPGSYISRHYPSLYRDFPNGFYVLPDTQRVATTSNTVTTTNNQENRPKFADVSNIQSNLNTVTVKPQPANYYISNYTHVGEKKTFVNHVELKPVSTKLTRFGGQDGKMYMKVVSSDSDGKEKITESEYTGNIDLKITNGVLDTPVGNSTSSISDTNVEKADPNSIIPEIEPLSNTTSEPEENKEEEDGRPLDITSWLG